MTGQNLIPFPKPAPRVIPVAARLPEFVPVLIEPVPAGDLILMEAAGSIVFLSPDQARNIAAELFRAADAQDPPHEGPISHFVKNVTLRTDGLIDVEIDGRFTRQSLDLLGRGICSFARQIMRRPSPGGAA